MNKIESISSFAEGQKVTVNRLEKDSYTDEGEIISVSGERLKVKITKSDKAEIEGKIIELGYRNGIWNYINEGGTYSSRDEGYNIVKI